MGWTGEIHTDNLVIALPTLTIGTSSTKTDSIKTLSLGEPAKPRKIVNKAQTGYSIAAKHTIFSSKSKGLGKINRIL